MLEKYRNKNFHYIPRNEEYRQLLFINQETGEEFYIDVTLKFMEGDRNLLYDSDIVFCLESAVSNIPWIYLDNRSSSNLGEINYHRVNTNPYVYRINRNFIYFYKYDENADYTTELEEDPALILEVKYYCDGEDVTDEML